MRAYKKAEGLLMLCQIIYRHIRSSSEDSNILGLLNSLVITKAYGIRILQPQPSSQIYVLSLLSLYRNSANQLYSLIKGKGVYCILIYVSS